MGRSLRLRPRRFSAPDSGGRDVDASALVGGLAPLAMVLPRVFWQLAPQFWGVVRSL